MRRLTIMTAGAVMLLLLLSFPGCGKDAPPEDKGNNGAETPIENSSENGAEIPAPNGNETPAENGPPLEPAAIKIAYTGHDQQIALCVAALAGEEFKDKGVYLKETKSRETYDIIDNGEKTAEISLLKAETDAGVARALEKTAGIGLLSVPAALKSIDAGSALKIVSFLSTGGDLLVGRKNIVAGISKNPQGPWWGFTSWISSRDGKLRVGYDDPNSAAMLTFKWAADHHNVAEKIEYVQVSPAANLPASLEKGDIDAFVCHQPFPSIAVAGGFGKIIADLREIPPRCDNTSRPTSCIAVAESVLKDPASRRALKSFLKVITIATDVIKKDTPGAVKLAAEWNKTGTKALEISIPGIFYIVEFNKRSRKNDNLPKSQQTGSGMSGWGRKIRNLGAFSNKLENVVPPKLTKTVADFSVLNTAIKELKDSGSLK